VDAFTQSSPLREPANTVKVEIAVLAENTDWFQLYWQTKRMDYYQAEIGSAEQLRSVAKRLEGEIGSFWKFRARNTLRLMQLHSGRRNRMLCAFAFQKFKVQTMKATLQKVLITKLHASEEIQNHHSSA